jgi:hypothetical protein
VTLSDPTTEPNDRSEETEITHIKLDYIDFKNISSKKLHQKKKNSQQRSQREGKPRDLVGIGSAGTSWN